MLRPELRVHGDEKIIIAGLYIGSAALLGVLSAAGLVNMHESGISIGTRNGGINFNLSNNQLPHLSISHGEKTSGLLAYTATQLAEGNISSLKLTKILHNRLSSSLAAITKNK